MCVCFFFESISTVGEDESEGEQSDEEDDEEELDRTEHPLAGLGQACAACAKGAMSTAREALASCKEAGGYKGPCGQEAHDAGAKADAEIEIISIVDLGWLSGCF